MKKKMTLAFIAAIAGVSMALTSCSDEIPAPSAAVSGEDVYMTFAMSLPTGISTYADEETTFGNSSLEGGFKNLEDKGDYYVRYIMEIYKYDDSADDKCGERVERQIKYKPLTADAGYRDQTFSGVRLKNNTKYITLFWSDIVMKFSQAPIMYSPEYENKPVTVNGVQYDNLTSIAGLNTSEYYANPYFYSNPEGDGNGNVLYNAYRNLFIDIDIDDSSVMFYVPADIKTICAGDPVLPVAIAFYPAEMSDGYYAKEILDLNETVSEHSITLKRPFAKLRFVTTDANTVEETLGLDVDDFDWSQTLPFFNISGSDPNEVSKPVFSLLTGETESHKIFPEYKGYWTREVGRSGTYSVENTNGERTLGAIYIPGNQPKAYNWSFSFIYYPQKGDDNVFEEMSYINVYSLPLVTNKVTTVKGSFLSSYYDEGDISISIDDGLEEYSPEYGPVNF